MKIVIEEGNKPAVPALLSKEAIKKDQDKIRVNLLSLDKAIHENAVQCLMHAEKHGDTSLMRRLLIEVVDAKSGYRRQGLINWMRKFSPMELKGDTINLSGVTPNGEKRPFKIEEANSTPFTTDRDNAEKVARPVFQDTLLSPINRAVKQIMDAMENTINGKPIDASKPFFEGLHGDKVVEFAKFVQNKAAELPKDSTLEVHRAKLRIAEDSNFVKANEGDAVAKMAANG